jgi:beta-lactamase regulating signal transducer with metallopeptidase domain
MMSSSVFDTLSALCGRALLDSVWLGLLCTLIVSIALYAAPVSAATRYTTRCLLLITLICLPFGTIAGSFLHTAGTVTPLVGSSTPSAGAIEIPGVRSVAKAQGAHRISSGDDLWNASEAMPSKVPWLLTLQRIARYLINGGVVVWTLVAMAYVVRLIVRLARLRAVKRIATCVPSEITLPRGARVLSADAAQMPCALGYFRPAIVVPPTFVRGLPEFDRHQILIHEAAHLRRYDDWTTLLYHVARCLLWFNPAVYVVGRAMSIDREIACDDLVVAATGKPRRYAQTIWTAAQGMLSPSLPLASGILQQRSHALVRLQCLLGPRQVEPTRLSRLVFCCAALIGCIALAVTTCLAPARAWPRGLAIASVAPMQDLRADHTATLLRNGDVLIAGGLSGNNPETALKTAELYHPKFRAFTVAGSMFTARGGASATLLRDGNVLIAGGWTPSGITAEAELYDARAGEFERAGSMHTARANHTATMLSDGRVLFSGGAVGDAAATASAEVYDPQSRAFSAVGSMNVARSEHAAALLDDGRVLVVGGDSDGAALASAEVFDPKTDVFNLSGSMSSPRTKLAAVRLRDGKVLVMGGQTGGPGGARESTAEVFDPVSDTFQHAGSMHDARFKINNAAVLLSNGEILIAGGSERAELYDEVTDRFSLLSGSLGLARHFGTATALADGSVLVAGGYSLPNPQTTNSAVVLTL